LSIVEVELKMEVKMGDNSIAEDQLRVLPFNPLPAEEENQDVPLDPRNPIPDGSQNAIPSGEVELDSFVGEDEHPHEDGNPKKKRRGLGLRWIFTKAFPTKESALEAFSKANLILNEQTLGRKTKGILTSVIYVNCKRARGGCEKSWRIVITEGAEEVIVEETFVDHSNHDKCQRNGGRGKQSYTFV
jgi:hypothetical protein